MAGKTVGGVVEPGGHTGIAMGILEPCLSQQGIPGEIPVVDEQVPHDAGEDQYAHQKRYQKSGEFFHKNAPFQENLKQLYIICEIKSSLPENVTDS